MTATPEGAIRRDPTPAEIEELVATTPPSGKKRSLGFLAFVACLGSLLFGYDTGVIAGALPFMHMPHAAGGLQLTAFEEGLIGGLLAIGHRPPARHRRPAGAGGQQRPGLAARRRARRRADR